MTPRDRIKKQALEQDHKRLKADYAKLQAHAIELRADLIRERDGAARLRRLVELQKDAITAKTRVIEELGVHKERLMAELGQARDALAKTERVAGVRFKIKEEPTCP